MYCICFKHEITNLPPISKLHDHNELLTKTILKLTGDFEDPSSFAHVVLCPAGVVAEVVASERLDDERVPVAGPLQLGGVVGQLHLVVLVPVHHGHRVRVHGAHQFNLKFN